MPQNVIAAPALNKIKAPIIDPTSPLKNSSLTKPGIANLSYYLNYVKEFTGSCPLALTANYRKTRHLVLEEALERAQEGQIVTKIQRRVRESASVQAYEAIK